MSKLLKPQSENPEAMKMLIKAAHGASKDALEFMANSEPWAAENRENWILDALRIGQSMGEIRVAEDFMRAFDVPFEPLLKNKDMLDKLGIDLSEERNEEEKP